LERYLDSLRPDRGHLALFCRSLQSVPKEVLDCSGNLYRRPPGRDHFLWEDLHGWIPAANDGPLRHLRKHFADTSNDLASSLWSRQSRCCWEIACNHSIGRIRRNSV
jgi:hypothetical protein